MRIILQNQRQNILRICKKCLIVMLQLIHIKERKIFFIFDVGVKCDPNMFSWDPPFSRWNAPNHASVLGYYSTESNRPSKRATVIVTVAFTCSVYLKHFRKMLDTDGSYPCRNQPISSSTLQTDGNPYLWWNDDSRVLDDLSRVTILKL